MSKAGIRVAHAIPGRIRLKVEGLRGNPTLAKEMSERIWSLPGVQRVEANVTTGSLLVAYDERAPGWHDHGRALAEALAPLWGVHADAVLRDFHAPSDGTNRGLAVHPHHVTGVFSALNEQVQWLTGGTGLKLLVPLALVLFGVRGLLVADRVAPRWYDLLWFGFATFLMLNAAGVPVAKAAEEAAEVATAV